MYSGKIAVPPGGGGIVYLLIAYFLWKNTLLWILKEKSLKAASSRCLSLAIVFYIEICYCNFTLLQKGKTPQ
jgi:hypothetical protein